MSYRTYETRREATVQTTAGRRRNRIFLPSVNGGHFSETEKVPIPSNHSFDRLLSTNCPIIISQ
ncbi:hypothetical protein [Parabacteroides sp.]